MKKAPLKPSKLLQKREAYRLWFEFLKLAHSIQSPKVRASLARSAKLYEGWGDIRNEEFHAWWTKHAELFEERFTVRKLVNGETPRDLTALIVEIPLNIAQTTALKSVKVIMRNEVAARAKSPTNRKKRSIHTSDFYITEGTEPKLAAIREMLTVYRDIYLKNPNLKGRKRLQAVHDHYLSRKSKKWKRIPTSLMADINDDARVATVLRTISRYISNAEAILMNVANGTFPGPYASNEKE
jgi:hypothetical protein